jgi:hypothetical protein
MKQYSNLPGLVLFFMPPHRGLGRVTKATLKEEQMKILYGRALGIALTAAVALMQAQDLRRVLFAGMIDDYSPSTVAGGPYEIRGDWTLDVGSSAGTATFTAALNMETSDYGITGATQVDPTNPATRSPHTHHIAVTSGTVSYDTSVCPVNSPATTGAGVVVTGPVSISGNGAPAPFESKGSTTVQICIIGGPDIEYSNFTMVFTGSATSHFGPQAIHGVVRKVSAK